MSTTASNMNKDDMYSQILLMTLQSKTDMIDANGMEEIITKKNASPFIIDDNGNSLLHWCSWRKFSPCNKYLINTYNINKFILLNQLLQTPLHWSCMSGDIESIKLFDGKYDLSYLSKDIDGYNSLITAAQFNQCAVLEYFKLKYKSHLDLNQIDNKGRTVLHWAVFKQNTIIIEWLLQNHPDPKQLLFIKDLYGDTALHIAAKNKKMKSIMTIIKNIDDDDIVYQLVCMKNLDNFTAYDLAKENGNKAVQKLLKKIRNRYDKFWWTILMNIFGNEMMISTSSMKRVGVGFTWYFLIMQIGGVLMNFSKFTYDSNNIFVDIIFHIFAFGGVIMWTITHFTDPGIIKKPTEGEIQDMFNGDENKSEYVKKLLCGDTSKLCITCRVVKEFRSKHCAFCNNCVKTFDHHCPWVNNCIGQQNYKYFIWFMFIEIGSMLNIMIFIIRHLCIINGKDIDTFIEYLFCTMISVYFIFAFITSIFVLVQIYSHIKLITNGYTTNEFLNMVRYSYFRDKNGNLRNPFYKGIMNNWYIFCFEACSVDIKNKDKMIDIENAPIIAKAVTKNDIDKMEEQHNKCKKKKCKHEH